MTRRQRIIGLLLRAVSLAALFGLWQWYGSEPSHIATPPPTKVFPALWKALTQQSLGSNTLGTLGEVVVGLAVSLVFGLVVGFAIALFPWAKDTLDPLVDALYAMPVTMLIPIVGVYTGLGYRGRIFIIFTYVALVIVISTSTGVREVEKGLIETARAYRVRGLAYFRKVLFPAALAHIAAGTAIGVSRAVRGAVTAELLLVTANLGGYLVREQAIFNNAALLAGIFWTLVLGYVLYELALWAEKLMTPWRRARA
jgi:NitT/TauT family transport system permease protein